MIVAYGYDHSGRPTGITYPQGSGTPDVVITYTNYGRTVTMVDGSGTSKWIHDGFGRLTRFEQPGWNIDYGYQNYHDTPVSMTDPSGVTGYQYDNRGNLWKLTNPVNEVTEWLYDPAGRLSQRKLGNGTWEEVSYDSRSRVTGIALKKPGATLRQHTYGYNAVSNVTSHSVAGVTTSYGYDLADQLISESRLGYAASYTYDANGNRATRTVNGVTETHVSDAADKLMSISVGGNTVRSFTYDGRGRRKTDTSSGNTTVYSWDAESRLVGMTKPGLATSYGYNGLDARTSRTVGASTTTYKRAGAYVTDPVLSETTGQFSANYTPGVSERRAGVSTFLHSGLKNADARTTDGSSVTAERQYDAFGNLTGGNGTWNGPFGYAGGFGYQEDGESGLKLLGHRYYDSSTGRFISKDPIGAGRNWYGYCDNNPLASFDSTGLDKRVASALYKRSPHLGKRYETDKKFYSEMHRRIGKKKKEEQPYKKGKDKEETNPNLTDEQLGDIAEDLDAERPAKKARDSKMQLHDGDERTPSYRPLPVSPPRPSFNWGAVGMGVLVVGGAVLVGLAVAASGGTLAPVALAAAAVVVTGTAATRKRPVPGG